jgi:hypothetical protein
MKIGDPTSIKQIIQSLMADNINIILGRVTQESPLQITAINDAKLILNEKTAVIPRHLTDYTTNCDITLSGGTIDGTTTTNDGEFPHNHSLKTLNIYNAAIKIHNALRKGDLLYILSYNHGKKYFVLDRVAEKDGAL